MYNVLFYGSMMHPAELARIGLGAVRVVPVRFRGYTRVFSQEPARRKLPGPERAVLRLEQADRSWVNGILCPGIAEERMPALKARERGYTLETISLAALSAYEDRTSVPDGDVVTYIGRPERRNVALLPNPEYLALCLEGARFRGQAFYAEFLGTTHLGDGSRLADYLRTQTIEKLGQT